jgi:hypothetical protein
LDLAFSNKDLEKLSGHVRTVRPITTVEIWIGHQFGTPGGDALRDEIWCRV